MSIHICMSIITVVDGWDIGFRILTHWGRVTHVCIYMPVNYIIIGSDKGLKFVPNGPINYVPAFGSDNGLTLARRQTIVWTNDG